MALSEFHNPGLNPGVDTYDMNVIAQLTDEPNVDDGLTAAQLKAKFDEGGLAIQTYINGTLKNEIDGIENGSNLGSAVLAKQAEWVQSGDTMATLNAAYAKSKLMLCVSGSSIYRLVSKTSNKYLFTRLDNKKYSYLVCDNGTWNSSSEELATKNSPSLSGTPTAPTASAGTNSTQIATTAFVKTAIDNAVMDTPNLADGAVETAKIDDEAVTTAKLADDAVTLVKLDSAVTDAIDEKETASKYISYTESGGTVTCDQGDHGFVPIRSGITIDNVHSVAKLSLSNGKELLTTNIRCTHTAAEGIICTFLDGSTEHIIANDSNGITYTTGGGGGSVSPYTSAPADLGTADAGSSDDYARGDHVHEKPTLPSYGIGYATCSTATIQSAKTASLTGYTLTTGGIVSIKFANQVSSGATLNINSTGAKSIYYHGSAIASGVIKGGDTATLIYDGVVYHVISVDRDEAPVTSVNGQTGAVSLSIPSTASDVGAIAAPSSPATGSFLVYNGSAWVAQTLSTWQGGSY